MRRSGALPALVLGLALAVPAAAEIYRWRDASGREHFTTDLQQVPPEQREGARERAAEPPGGSVTFHSGDDVRPKAAATPRTRPSPAAPAPAQAGLCQKADREAARLRRILAKRERHAASLKRSADDIRNHFTTRAKNQARYEEALRTVDAAKTDLRRFEAGQRQAGVEPGCLR